MNSFLLSKAGSERDCEIIPYILYWSVSVIPNHCIVYIIENLNLIKRLNDTNINNDLHYVFVGMHGVNATMYFQKDPRTNHHVSNVSQLLLQKIYLDILIYKTAFWLIAISTIHQAQAGE